MGDGYIPIDCSLHDYIEIACLKRYRLSLELIDGAEIEATAESTQTRADKTEWLLLCDGERQHCIRLDHIVAMTPVDDGADFGRILLRA